jgi:hypothetical protein
VIARSPIVFSNLCWAKPGVSLAGLVDLAILDWITAEGCRIGRNIARI